MRIGIGAGPNQRLPARVLEYSIHRTSSREVECVRLGETDIETPVPEDPDNRARTPFSFQRFLIPELFEYQNRAMYLDSDMLVFQDIAEVFDWPDEDFDVLAPIAQEGRRVQYSVLLIDCARARWDIRELVAALDRGKLSYWDLMMRLEIGSRVEAKLPAGWNSQETYTEGQTRLLHYTDVLHQPWTTRTNRLAYLWYEQLFSALDEGFIGYSEVVDAVEAGAVRPSLRYQVDTRISSPEEIPRSVAEQDAEFDSFCKAHNFNF